MPTSSLPLSLLAASVADWYLWTLSPLKCSRGDRRGWVIGPTTDSSNRAENWFEINSRGHWYQSGIVWTTRSVLKWFLTGVTSLLCKKRELPMSLSSPPLWVDSTILTPHLSQTFEKLSPKSKIRLFLNCCFFHVQDKSNQFAVRKKLYSKYLDKVWWILWQMNFLLICQ